ncbi:uncharacterized protein LOC134271125 [Saccostrea cucullata]|uniref:uncharacterized protein LOC134271125 n=1 Tax=Saccostrea cuccullata TaxID=36930 RepID=UPI002ED30048
MKWKKDEVNMIRCGILILCVSGCFAKLSSSAGSLRLFPEPEPRNQGNQVPFEPIYIPIAETPVSQSIQPFIGPLLSQINRQNGGQNRFQLPNGPNVPFPGGSPGIGHGMHSRSVTQTSEVPVIGFDDFMTLIRRSTVGQSGTGQDMTYVNLGSLIPRAPIVAIPSNTLPRSLRQSSETAVSQQTRVSGGQGPLSPVHVSSLTQGRSAGFLSSALANINRVPQIPLHPVAALHHAVSRGRIPHPGLAQQAASLRIPSTAGGINSGLNQLHSAASAARQVAVNTNQRTVNAVQRSLFSSGQLPGPIHPSILRTFSNTVSIPRSPLHHIVNTAATGGIIPRGPVSGILSNIGNGDSGVPGGQGRFGTTSRQFSALSSGVGNLPLVSRPTVVGSPFTSSVQPDFNQRENQRRSSISSFTMRSNNPLTVNRVTIPGPLNEDRRNSFSQTFGLDQNPVPGASSVTNDFVRRSSFDDFLPRDPLRRNNLPDFRGFSGFNDFTPRSPISIFTRRSDELNQPSGFSRTRRFDNTEFRSFQGIPRDRGDIFNQPSRMSTFDEFRPISTRPLESPTFDSGFDNFAPRSTFSNFLPRSSQRRTPFFSDIREQGDRVVRPRAQFHSNNGADFPRNLDPLSSSRGSNLPSSLDERLQEDFIRNNFALPRQFDPISRNFDPVTSGRGPLIVSPSASILPPLPRFDTRNQQNQESFPFREDTTRRLGEPSNILGPRDSSSFVRPTVLSPVFGTTDNNLGTLRRGVQFSGPDFNDIRGGRFADPWNNRFSPGAGLIERRDGRFDEPWNNRFGPERFFDQRDDPFGNRFDPGNRFDRSDERFDDRRGDTMFDDQRDEVFDDQFDRMDRNSFTPFFQPRFSPLVRPFGSRFSISPVSRELTRAFQRSPNRRPRGSFMISFLVNIDDVSDAVDEVDFNRRISPGFQNRFIPRRGFAFGGIDNSPIGPFERRNNRPIGPFDGIDNSPIRLFDRRANRPMGQFEGIDNGPIDPFDRTDNGPIRPFDRSDIGPTDPFIGRENGPIGPFGSRDSRPIGPFDGRNNRPIGPFDSRDNRPIGPFDRRNNGPIGTFGSRDNRPIGPFIRRDNGPIGPFDRSDNGPIAPFDRRDIGPIRPFDGRDIGPMGLFDGRNNGPIGPFDGINNGPMGPIGGRNNGPIGSFDGRDNGPLGPFGGRNNEPIGPFDRRDNGPMRPFGGRNNGPIGPFDGNDNGPLGSSNGRNFLSSVPFIPPMAPSPASRVLPPITSPVVSRSLLSPDRFTDQNRDFRQGSRRLDPFSEPVRSIRENPRPFAVAIPDPDGPRNQPFLTAAIEGQFDGPATDIDFNSAFNRRQPSLTSEPVEPFPDRRTIFNLPIRRDSTSDISSRQAPSNFQHLLNLGNSVVHSRTSQITSNLFNVLNLRRPNLASQSLGPTGGLRSRRPAVTNAQHLLNIGNSIIQPQTSSNILAFGNTIGSQRPPLITSRQPVNTVVGRIPFVPHSSFTNRLHVKHATHFGGNFRQVPRGVSGLLNLSLRGHRNIRHFLPLGRHIGHIARAGGPTLPYSGFIPGSQNAYRPFK